MILSGREESTFHNYIRAIAQASLHYRKLPLDLTDNEINHYLTLHKTGQLDRLKPSEAYFKHAVFGFRYMYKTFGIEDRHIAMPLMKRKKLISDILNRYEVIELLKACGMKKHKIIFALAYGSGLRVREVRNCRIQDIDVIRKTVHVRDSKNGYDRIVPISSDFIRGYMDYKNTDQIVDYIFPGQKKDTPMSTSAIQHALITARRKANIYKKISMHNLRHSYATHFLEDTGDLLLLKRYMGHRDIKNTMRYLKSAQAVPESDPYSPLTKVFELARQNRSTKP